MRLKTYSAPDHILSIVFRVIPPLSEGADRGLDRKIHRS